MKTCFTCGLDKDLVEYYTSKQNKDGYMGRCKKCHLEYSKARRKAKKEMVNECNRKWRANNREKDRESKRKYDLAHTLQAVSYTHLTLPTKRIV